MPSIEIVPVVPFDDGVAAGRKFNSKSLEADTRERLKDQYIKDSLGAMGRAELTRWVMAKLDTPPDYTRFPELQDIYPEIRQRLRGFAEGAGVSLEAAAVHDYLVYRNHIDHWWHPLNPTCEPGHCSGAMLVGPEGVLAAHSIESGPKVKMPKNFKHPKPRPYRGMKVRKKVVDRLVLRKPRTGYIESWGVSNEKGVAIACGNSCSTWLDDPIEDTWPFQGFPVLRFAQNVRDVIDLYTRYTLHLWSRASMIFCDTTGDGVVIEKSFRRVGFRRIGPSGALCCTEGHFESAEMNAFIRRKRLEYLERMGKHLGAGDMQYANDCAVRFTRLAEMVHEDWGRGYEHMRKVLTDHATFPRAVCRHMGPDTAPYDRTVTQQQNWIDLTHNRSFVRKWVPWKKFCCEVAEEMTQFPARPG
jgi:hypothetical protein